MNYTPIDETDQPRIVGFHNALPRRGMIRSAVLRVIDLGVELEREIDCLRDEVAYYKHGKKDRDVYRQVWHSIRDIVRGWAYVTREDETAFRAGTMTPHRLFSRIETARRAALAS